MIIGILGAVFIQEDKNVDQIKEVRLSLNNRLVVERCVTCHAAEEHQPVAGHDPLRESCTACHNGMGRGITADTAHMIDTSLWAKGGRTPIDDMSEELAEATPANLPSGGSGDHPEALFRGEEVWAGCLRCHSPGQLPDSSPVAAGMQMFIDKACIGCHSLAPFAQGIKGPELDGIGDKLSLVTLTSRILEPQGSGLFNIMPLYGFSPPQARQVALFLKGQSKRFPKMAAGNNTNPSETKGLNCAACHKLDNEDGGIAPDLNLLFQRRDAAWVEKFLQDPHALRPFARMPGIDAEAGRRAVGEIASGSVGMVGPRTPAAQYTAYCARCHGEDGAAQDSIALNLNTYPRLFQGNADFFRLTSRPRLLRAIETGIPGTAMPPSAWLLSAGERSDLLDYIIRTFAGIDPKDTLADIEVPPPPVSMQVAQGESLFEAHCAKCHGTEGDKSVKYTHHRNPQARNFTNRLYLDSRSDEELFRTIARGVPGTRMKAYLGAVPGSNVKTRAFLATEEIWSLVKHVRRLSQNER